MTDSRIQWVLVCGTALVMEIVLIAALLPMSWLVERQAVRIPIACLVVSFVVTFWASRWIRSQLLLHGLLIGIVATAIYLALVSAFGGGIASALSRYGTPLFVGFNAMRLLGTLTAAAVRQHQRVSAEAVPLDDAVANRGYRSGRIN